MYKNVAEKVDRSKENSILCHFLFSVRAFLKFRKVGNFVRGVR